jgi:hypothetical protein
LFVLLFLNFTTAQTNRANTTTNITAVTIITKRDRSKIHWAGVDTGAKILVGLRGERAGSARLATANAERGTRVLSARTYRSRHALAVVNSEVLLSDVQVLYHGRPSFEALVLPPWCRDRFTPQVPHYLLELRKFSKTVSNPRLGVYRPTVGSLGIRPGVPVWTA